MRRKLLLILPARKQLLAEDFRQIKYSLFPPLSLQTIAALTPEDRYEIIIRNEHVESSEVDVDVDLVGMTVYISSARRAYELAARHRRRGAKVVLGGIHPTTMPAEAAGHADAVCIGPAEPVWGQILSDLERGELQRYYRGDPAGSAALSPPARRDLTNPNSYLVHQTMVTSRGCPHSCDFCYKSRFWGPHYHEGRPLHVLERELESMDGSFFFILDDNFLGARRHAREVFALLRASGKVWQAAGSLDVARSPAFLAEAHEAGCRSLFVGFESLSPQNLREANKTVNAATDYAEAVRRFHDAGIMLNGSFVFGFDGDGPDAVDRTLDFAIENKLETATFHVLTPFPGTRLFERMAAEGRLLHRDWQRYDACHAVFRPRGMSPEALEAGQRRAYKDFYRYGSILKRSLGLSGALKRLLINVGWKKMDWFWRPVLRHGLLPYVRPILDRVLASNARSRAAQVTGEQRAPQPHPKLA